MKRHWDRLLSDELSAGRMSMRKSSGEKCRSQCETNERCEGQKMREYRTTVVVLTTDLLVGAF